MTIPPRISTSRQAEILAQFQRVLDAHLDDFLAGRVEKMLELQEIAVILCLHPGHLSKVIRLTTGQHACHFYEQRLLCEAKVLLLDPALPIKAIAHRLDYDESNFTKFFKRFTGITPSAFRKAGRAPTT